MSSPRVLYWFRTDLRLHDSPALLYALSLSPTVLYPVFTWDPHYVRSSRVSSNRWKYLLDCQSDLSSSISAINPTQKLLVVRESPLTVLCKLLKTWKITHLVFEADPDAYARERDKEVVRAAEEIGVTVAARYGRTLWDSARVVQEAGGPTMTIAALMAAGKKIGDVPRPLPVPRTLPDLGDTSLEGIEQSLPTPMEDLNAPHRATLDSSYSHGLAGPNGDFSVLTLPECGLHPATTPHRGGEKLALAALDKQCADVAYICGFSKPETAPTSLSPPSTTLLSPHLHFGSLSVRLFYWRVSDILAAEKKKPKGQQMKCTEPPTSLLGQLYFRDMYFAAYHALGRKFHSTLGNPKCKYVDWHLPTSGPQTAVGDSGVPEQKAAEWLKRWKTGTTGYPWIDACMRQLAAEGWIHHLARHAVACFLTRGGCYISWERGAEVFEEYLLDHEPACNLGNWMWLSATGFYSQYFRIYSPVAFPKKTDTDEVFVRSYIPELEGVDARWIYEPWKAPEEVRKQVYRERGYPERIFEWEERRAVCLKGMKTAYKANLMGDDERVVEGKWEEIAEALKKAAAEEEKAHKGTESKPKKAPKKRGMEKGQQTLDALMKRPKI